MQKIQISDFRFQKNPKNPPKIQKNPKNILQEFEGTRRNAQSCRNQPYNNPAAIIVRANVTAVWIGTDRKPIRVPDEVRERLAGQGR